MAENTLSILHKLRIFDRPDYTTKKEADFLEKVLKLKHNDFVLDLGCGPGRLSIGLSKKGYKLYGLDIAPETIEYAKNKTKKKILT